MHRLRRLLLLPAVAVVAAVPLADPTDAARPAGDAPPPTVPAPTTSTTVAPTTIPPATVAATTTTAPPTTTGPTTTAPPAPTTTAAPASTAASTTQPPATPAPTPAPSPAPTAASAPASTLAPTPTPAAFRPLRILLTNDDGWDAEGITAVRDALVAAGHDVVIVAPATNQSGTGAQITFAGQFTLTQHAPSVFSVDGTPADATELGLDIAFGGERPDLVVSGSNGGHNVGAVAVHSGTLGAAVTALNEGVPAIAVSTELDLSSGSGDFEGSAAFVTTLVAALAGAAGDGPVLPGGLGMSVNFPLVESGAAPAGVAVTPTDTGYVDLDYAAVSVPPVGESTTIGPALTFLDPVDPDGDVARLAADFVTVTFITGDYDVASPPGAEDLTRLTALVTALG